MVSIMRKLEKHEWPIGSKKLYEEVFGTDKQQKEKEDEVTS